MNQSQYFRLKLKILNSNSDYNPKWPNKFIERIQVDLNLEYFKEFNNGKSSFTQNCFEVAASLT